MQVFLGQKMKPLADSKKLLRKERAFYIQHNKNVQRKTMNEKQQAIATWKTKLPADCKFQSA